MWLESKEILVKDDRMLGNFVSPLEAWKLRVKVGTGNIHSRCLPSFHWENPAASAWNIRKEAFYTFFFLIQETVGHPHKLWAVFWVKSVAIVTVFVMVMARGEQMQSSGPQTLGAPSSFQGLEEKQVRTGLALLLSELRSRWSSPSNLQFSLWSRRRGGREWPFLTCPKGKQHQQKSDLPWALTDVPCVLYVTKVPFKKEGKVDSRTLTWK